MTLSHERHLQVAEAYANFMDNRFSFLGIRFGVASLIDFIPGIGDILGVLLACYLLWLARLMKLPESEIAKMVKNITVAFFIGLFPVIGDMGDLFYKPNMRNFHILKNYASRFQEGDVVQPKILG